jgi:hypothetical protein
MMKLIKTISLLLLISTAGFGQKESPTVNQNLFFGKVGVGSSWITMPKVYIVDVSDSSSAQILPAVNSFSGYIGFHAVIPLGKRWIFIPEIDINYIAGQIRVDQLPSKTDKSSDFSQKLQSYTRIELPLNFGVVSSDNFWVSFGPVLYVTLSDNKGFDDAAYEMAEIPVNLDSDNPIGLRFRMAAYIIVAKGMYIDIKFDSDLGRNFEYVDDIYKMKMSLQSLTVGFGYRLNRADL